MKSLEDFAETVIRVGKLLRLDSGGFDLRPHGLGKIVEFRFEQFNIVEVLFRVQLVQGMDDLVETRVDSGDRLRKQIIALGVRNERTAFIVELIKG